MAKWTVDPVTGIKTKVGGTDYIPPCLAKTAERKKAFIPDPATETVTATDETGNKETD
ncbi:MAG: hypothetical protein RL661_922 [Pseudomonadota bacterium]|jgi:hypothetical protein